MPRIFRLPITGVIMLIVSYAAFVCILTFINANTHDDQRYQSIGVRAAWITMAQFPLVIVLANKRNFVGLVTGLTYERLNILHRWTARGKPLHVYTERRIWDSIWEGAGSAVLDVSRLLSTSHLPVIAPIHRTVWLMYF